ncbi:Bifunctional uridylyltransferase/uridylyl-removing enzyme (Includes: (Protein-PII) uridylyltransferase; (Protein-PII)-UMP uridylyl-removing enzyme) [Burkholderiales bacterium]|nr:Bifunctional uridylyltransferase/uridylyl-removing enzyme (Includes: (Protein-PII) uridylyltransferase; (Protein-PII)-UMP uridylyl-removing enzyme) [Burkholderiales bacterium]
MALSTGVARKATTAKVDFVRDQRQALSAEREQLIAIFEQGAPVRRLLNGLSRLTDRYVRLAADHTGVSRFASLVAVGGYGRGELFPYSDVDLLIIPRAAPDAEQQGRIATLVQLLWDLGLAIGHAVRTAPECGQQASQDATVMTSLLESRRICGPKSGFEALRKGLQEVLDARGFLQAKLLEQQQRHTKYEDTPYALEPNCKESPGGLRDLQVLLWVSRAAGLGASWDEMTRNSLLTAAECRQIKQTERHLQQIRARLHIVARRHEDRLVFDLQHALAGAVGIKGTPARRASEVLMQTYYHAAKIVVQLNTLVLLSVEQRLYPDAASEATHIDDAFCARAERLDIVDDKVLERDPNEILRAFLTWERHPELKGMTPRLLRAVWNARNRMDGAFRRAPENRANFLAILQQSRGVLHTLRLMNQWSVLGGYLPVFRRIVGQMQHDLFHVYTVDQHILMVVRNLRRFSASEFAHEYPLCSQLIADFDRPWLLLLAALFHDIAKGRGGDHSALGAAEARRFCRAHQLARADSDLVAFLVEHHLTMSQVAQKQDVADPTVIERFAKLVGSDRRLVALYLLTVADIRGTSPRVWNAWKARLLEDLFRRARRGLGGQSLGADAELEGRKRESLRILQLYGLSRTAHEPLWRELDVVYFLRHSASDIAWHARCLLVHVRTDRPVVRTRLAPAGEGLEVLVYTRDQKDLFVRVCGYFESRRLSILDAKIHTTRHGYALDTFLVSDNGRGGHFRSMLEGVETELTAWISGHVDLPAPAPGRVSRHSRHFPVAPAVHLQPDETGRHYMLSLVATDRVGLLYSVARVLARHGVNVVTAKILTLGERVEDVFLIDGQSLGQAREQLQLETDLLQALAPL